MLTVLKTAFIHYQFSRMATFISVFAALGAYTSFGSFLYFISDLFSREIDLLFCLSIMLLICAATVGLYALARYINKVNIMRRIPKDWDFCLRLVVNNPKMKETCKILNPEFARRIKVMWGD